MCHAYGGSRRLKKGHIRRGPGNGKPTNWFVAAAENGLITNQESNLAQADRGEPGNWLSNEGILYDKLN